MKLPDVFDFRFDPDKTDLPVLKHRIGKILWTCIKHRHITSQYFNNDILMTAERIEKEAPENYITFKHIIKTSPLSVFGKITIDENVTYSHAEMDHEFWGGVWALIKGRRTLRINITTPNKSIQPTTEKRGG